MTTLLVSPEEAAGATLEVAGAAYRHLFRARRLERGERLRVADGCGHARWARVAAVDRERATLELGGAAPANEPAVRVEVLVAAPRPQRLSWLVEKATEIGVRAVRVLATERAPRTLGRGSLERLRRVAAAAVEQCERSRLPEVTGVHPWPEIVGLLAGCERRWLLDPRGRPAASLEATRSSTAILVGPEGGWTEEERRQLESAGCSPLRVGPTTLRVETAALVGAALVLFAPGRTGKGTRGGAARPL